MPLHSVATPVFLGGICYVVLLALSSADGSGGLAYFAWLASITLAGFASGYLRPASSWRNGWIVAAAQPAMAVLHGLVTGDLFGSSSSTGGMVGLAIGTIFVVIFSPLPIGGSLLGAWMWRRRSAEGGESPS